MCNRVNCGDHVGVSDAISARLQLHRRERIPAGVEQVDVGDDVVHTVTRRRLITLTVVGGGVIGRTCFGSP